MKPHRIRMTHNLLLNYGLYRSMEIYVGWNTSICLFLLPSLSAHQICFVRRGHTKPTTTTWPSTTVMTTSSSSGPSDQTTCLSTANRCRDVSVNCLNGPLKPPCPHLIFTERLCFVSLLTVNVGEDCPVFDGLFEFCQLSTGGSVGKSSIHLTISNSLLRSHMWNVWLIGKSLTYSL